MDDAIGEFRIWLHRCVRPEDAVGEFRFRTDAAAGADPGIVDDGTLCDLRAFVNGLFVERAILWAADSVRLEVGVPRAEVEPVPFVGRKGSEFALGSELQKGGDDGDFFVCGNQVQNGGFQTVNSGELVASFCYSEAIANVGDETIVDSEVPCRTIGSDRQCGSGRRIFVAGNQVRQVNIGENIAVVDE